MSLTVRSVHFWLSEARDTLAVCTGKTTFRKTVAQHDYAELVGRSWFLEPDSCPPDLRLGLLKLATRSLAQAERDISVASPKHTHILAIIQTKGSCARLV